VGRRPSGGRGGSGPRTGKVAARSGTDERPGVLEIQQGDKTLYSSYLPTEKSYLSKNIPIFVAIIIFDMRWGKLFAVSVVLGNGFIATSAKH